MTALDSVAVESSVRAQAADPRTVTFDVRRLTREGNGAIYAVRADGEEIYCGWATQALALVKRWWKGQNR